MKTEWYDHGMDLDSGKFDMYDFMYGAGYGHKREELMKERRRNSVLIRPKNVDYHKSTVFTHDVVNETITLDPLVGEYKGNR